jgi:hypothetical protein
MNEQKDVVDGGRDGTIYGQGFPIQTSHVLAIDNTPVHAQIYRKSSVSESRSTDLTWCSH